MGDRGESDEKGNRQGVGLEANAVGNLTEENGSAELKELFGSVAIPTRPGKSLQEGKFVMHLP